jgi:hypothetical protein
MHYSPPSLSERAAAFDAIAVIDDYLPGGASPTVAFGKIITIVDLTGVHK